MSLIFNQGLLNLKRIGDEKKKQYEAALAALEQNDMQIKAQEKAQDDALEHKEGQLISQTNALFAQKFTAKLSEDKENIEVYSQNKILVGLYTKENNVFKPLELRIVGLTKEQDIDLARTKAQFYNIIQNIFK